MASSVWRRRGRALLSGVALIALIAGSAVGTASAQQAPAVGLGDGGNLGQILVGPNGMTLYMFTTDTTNVSNCYDQCATAWPPLLTEGQPVAPAGLDGLLGTTVRNDGSHQVTYNGMPLYYWFRDEKPGDTTGQNVGGVWFVVNPSPSPTLTVHQDPKLGPILTDSRGMSLYMFTRDGLGTSSCYQQCAANWPPLLTQNDPIAPGLLQGALGTTQRTDGTWQVTYNGMPLYYWAKDQKPGDALGQNVGGVWFVVNPAPDMTVKVRQESALGPILTDARGMTVYLFTNDAPGMSDCYDQCAVNWPPLLTITPPTGPDSIVAGLSTTQRTDGSMQVTYNGVPLYFWFRDQTPGDTTGQNVGGVWYVVNP